MISPTAIALGFTGPFGSGSTTSAYIIASRKGYQEVRLSQFIKSRWETDHPGEKSKRSQLQRLGNQMRIDANDPGALVVQALKELDEDNNIVVERLIIDGIRNLGEIQRLRIRFESRFYLFALECQQSERWERVKFVYEQQGLTRDDFNLDNEEDKDQENVFGQQVQLCVDQADVLIVNGNEVTEADRTNKLINYVELITGENPRYATNSEIHMNLAYSSAHSSKCIKRQVGAVLVAADPDKAGEVVGVGYNENPVGTNPCVEEPEYGADQSTSTPGRCYRDIVRLRSYEKMVLEKRHCPGCGRRLRKPDTESHPWRCQHSDCGVNLELFFWPERAMTLCTAVHAEVQAILNSRGRAEGSTLYTTTFPCFQCAETITQAKIKVIVFTEPYPDVRAAERLEIAGVLIARFEGVRSRRFDEIFSRALGYMIQLG